ncbi:Uma2 family endonuclease [Sphingomonas sp. PB4P5]|uniref:Uma2 family endonuclease n=1 Tax=Parasphingomonas puruogangriensis TaxID=3096155 RepID=UPI002FCBD14C
MTIHEQISQSHLAKLTVKDFLTLAEAGSFDRYARSELIEGEIWVVNSIHRTHARVQAEMTTEISIALRAAGLGLIVYANPSTELANDSLPEPDIVVGIPADSKLVAGTEVLLAVEVSVSTLKMDLGRKLRLYARHGIPEYWVIDPEAKVVHQFWARNDNGYAEVREISLGQAIIATTIDGLTVDTSRL